MTESVAVWRIDLRAEVGSGPLSREERERAGGFDDPAQRRRFTTAHVALREILGTTLGCDPGGIALSRGRYGKPRCAGPPFNLSHSGEHALLAVGTIREVGIDLEQVRPRFPVEAFARRYFPATEADLVGADPARYAALWTRKEACVKVAGERLVRGLRLPVAELDAPITAADERTAPGPFHCADLVAPTGYAAAVAVAGAAGFTVRYRSWRGRSRSHG
ncbi:MAG TPA: 4'-phosphopantetheinyl transferase superfamily protein [Mycobacteriales bacterium]|nr:4'-phosphopantetheinyl transferase superfamily protein [Mycobacteriales bacterium]